MITEKPATPTPGAKKLILLVDDHPIFRYGLEALLKKHQPELVCVHADTPQAALESIQDSPPAIAIVDVSLAGANGIELVTRIRAEQHLLSVIVLSMHDEPPYVLGAFKAGAQAYVIKTDPPRELLDAINSVVSGKIFLSVRLRQNPIFKLLSGGESMMGQLTDREAEVLLMMGRGQSTAAIAQELGLSVKTVETHQSHIKDKLALASGREMVQFAVNLVTYREM
ncbi:MAG: response regulator transcription factor [Verrucomicrobia bacterium]|nr:response regulator transcription factor [Verrucomicrobiota bacterium]MBV8279453.1 response regulator transcription factor [Verrucomicrobiota bacterium]